MQEPLNPLRNHDPLNPNQNPFEDPLLDALEHSIENPPGFTDPLVESDEPFIDDLAKQLDAVEASIENSPPIPPPPTPDGPAGETGGDEPTMLGIEPDVSSEGPEEDEGQSRDLLAPADRHHPAIWPRSHISSPLPRRPYGDGWRQGGRGLAHGSRRGGRSIGPRRSSLRYCPDSREAVDIDGASLAKNTGTGPEGTDEEPRECLYDWQAIPRSGEPDNERSDQP